MFAAVFSVFVVALIALCVLTIRFALRRDRVRRAEQLRDSKK